MANPRLRGSAHYIWWEKDVLGKGATASVFKCREKKTGDIYAVKVFTPTKRDQHQAREFEILRGLSHDNIVRTLQIEEETTAAPDRGPTKVIIMEYCNAGSLYSILDDPVNAYGLEEDEFLRFLEHISGGMKYLNEQKIVHRDIKPGNIMKIITPEGKHIYKLTDFGAARSLNTEEEGFMSLCGTEEYLHPDMYRRARLHHRGSDRGPSVFNASVDLWSVGVTIYHVATGNLPFRPDGGRSNPEGMYQILNQKKNGHISGVQDSHGRITYSDVLPDTCQLSLGLKELVQEVLVGVLETDPQKCVNFHRFYQAVQGICKRTRLHIFYPNKCSNITLFCDENELIADIRKKVYKQCTVAETDQVLLYDNLTLESLLTQYEQYGLSRAVRTSLENPVFLYCNNDTQDLEYNLPTHATIPKLPKYNTPYDLPADYSIAKQSDGIINYLNRFIRTVINSQKLLDRATTVFEQYLIERTRKVVHDSENALLASKETQSRFEFYRGLLPKYEEQRSPYNKLTETAEVCKRHAADYYRVLITERQLSAGIIRKDGDRLNCQSEDMCICKIKAITENVDECFKDFKRDRSAKQLPYNEEQIHKFEKNKLSEACTRALSLAQEHCHENTKHLHKRFQKWYKNGVKLNVKCMKLQEKIGRVEENQRNCSKYFSENEEAFRMKALQSSRAGRQHQSVDQEDQGYASDILRDVQSNSVEINDMKKMVEDTIRFTESAESWTSQ